MFTPKVEFVLPSVAKEARVLCDFCEPQEVGFDLAEVVFQCHPELKLALEGVTDDKKRMRICHAYANTYRKQNSKQFDSALRMNIKGWQSVEKKFLTALSEHVETKFPSNRKTLKAYVSMVPVYPRWLHNWTFNVSYFNPGRVREITCHEILHFVYFKKWMEVFPETKYEELDEPHLVWRLSEIITDVILNEHPYFKTLFKDKQRTYTQFQKIRIEGKRPVTHYTKMYKKHLRSGKHFEDFLHEIWDFTKKHQKVLMSV